MEMTELEKFFVWADRSSAVTWAGKLGLKERWLNRDNPEYTETLQKVYNETPNPAP